MVRQQRLTDRQALAVIGGYFGLRMVTVRVGLFYLPWLLEHAPWAIPLLRNALLSLIVAAAEAHDRPLLLLAIAMGSLFISALAGLMLYWAGYRFGPQLAERAQREGSVWASVWNPKHVARAHRFLERRGIAAVSVARATNWLVTPVALVAGSSRMSFGRYVAAYGIGAGVWTGAALWLGVRAGTTWPWLPDKIKSFSDWSLKIGLAALVLFVLALALSRGGKPDERGETTAP